MQKDLNQIAEGKSKKNQKEERSGTVTFERGIERKTALHAILHNSVL